MLRTLRLFWGITVLTLGGSIIWASVAVAASYDVTASVDFPAPTQAAVITSITDGSTVNVATQIVSGTCQALTPNGAVSIWRGGVAIGSAPCNGTFSVTVSLQKGLNALVARSASVSGLYGPDSTPVGVTLQLPSPLPTPNPVPANPGTVDDTSQNAGAAHNLSATPSQAFSTLDESESIILMVVVVGSSTPYTIHINWGDGSEEARTVDKPGTYQFSHTYAKDGAYTIKGVVRDVLGATTTFHYAVVSRKPAVTTSGPKSHTTDAAAITTQISDGTPLWWPLMYILVGAAIALLGYRLGVMRTRRFESEPAPVLPTTEGIPPKPKSKKRRTL